METTQVSFGQFLEAAPDAMVVVDRRGRIRLVNGHAEDLFGYTHEELIGEPVEMLVPRGQQDQHARQRQSFQGDPHRRPMGIGLELRGRRKDESWFPVEISLSPVETQSGTWIMAAVRDSSERVRVERVLKATNQELESFTYSVSHDLRAPIRQIDGFARMLDELAGDDLGEEAAHYMERIKDGTAKMGRLVDDLLHLARLGRQSLQLRSIELGELVEQVIADVAAEEASDRQIEWRVKELPSVVGDAGLLRIVFTNLFANAVKYTRPSDPAVIEVGASARDGCLVISVRDNGVGFDMAYADKLFGVFQRLHRAEEFEGMGVGLATVQRIVHKHGGEIWCDAAPDEGATFSFSLPVDDLARAS